MAAQLAPLKQCSPNSRIRHRGSAAPEGGRNTQVRQGGHDLTPFFQFALEGLFTQSQRVVREMQHQIAKVLYKSTMFELFKRLKSPKKRLIAERQMEILKLLLEVESMDYHAFWKRIKGVYEKLKDPGSAMIRDLNNLIYLKAINIKKISEDQYNLSVRLEWPKEITESDFFAKIKTLPKAKTLSFLG